MRIGIFADVHGNIDALDVVLEALKGENVNRMICVGDLVGYGPNPNQCVEKIMETADVVVAGNHDYAAVNRTSIERFNENAKGAMEWTRRALDGDAGHQLSLLPMIWMDEIMTVVHATPEVPEEWRYIFSGSDAYRNLKRLTTPLCFVGHSHLPVVFSMDQSGDLLLQEANRIEIDSGRTYLINVGSVGQPRDGDPRAAYGVLDTDENQFELKRLPYPVERVQEKMKKERLPVFLIERLAIGM